MFEGDHQAPDCRINIIRDEGWLNNICLDLSLQQIKRLTILRLGRFPIYKRNSLPEYIKVLKKKKSVQTKCGRKVNVLNLVTLQLKIT